MSEIVCVKCQVYFRKTKVGVAAVPMCNRPPEPYQLWMADLLTCPGCNAQIVSGFAQRPIGEHYQEGFRRRIEQEKTPYYIYERVSDVPKEKSA